MCVILFDQLLVFFLEEPIKESFLAKVAESLGGYFNLGLILGVPSTFIEQQENAFPKNTTLVTTKVLLQWQKISEKRHNMFNMMEELINALEWKNLTDVADMVRRGECSVGPFHCWNSGILIGA